MKARTARDKRSPPLGVEEIREASRSFKHKTAVGPDGLHVRHFGMTSDRGLECVSRIWKLVEGTGIYPGQIKRVVVPLIPKAEGAALRPIGFFLLSTVSR